MYLHRDFILGSYVEIKKTNPGFPFLIREATDVEPQFIARYGADIFFTQTSANAGGAHRSRRRKNRISEKQERSTSGIFVERSHKQTSPWR